MDNNDNPNFMKSGSRIQDGEAKNQKESPTEEERIDEYLQIVEKFLRTLREKFTITPEISDQIIGVYNAIDNQDFLESTRHLKEILKIVKETRKQNKDFDLDGILAAFTGR